VIISADGLRITHIDKNYELTRWRLADVIATSLAPPSSDPDQAKFDQRLVDKLKYCRDVLVSIKNASEDQGAEKATVSAAKPLERHASKALLR
jgi:cell cycle serine/threonine-protein kinase CDC5/MSD2